jgi:hypothetical protein
MKGVRLIMDLINALLLLVMLVGSCVALVTYVQWLDANKLARDTVTTQRDATHAARATYRIAATTYSCMPDGVAITSLDQLRDAVLVYDRLLTHGDAHGHPVKLDYVLGDARRFAKDFGDAERGAFLMEQCMGWLSREYPAGFNALYTAMSKAAFHGA